MQLPDESELAEDVCRALKDEAETLRLDPKFATLSGLTVALLLLRVEERVEKLVRRLHKRRRLRFRACLQRRGPAGARCALGEAPVLVSPTLLLPPPPCCRVAPARQELLGGVRTQPAWPHWVHRRRAHEP